MHYVIDGYNVAHALFGRTARRASPEEMRETLLRYLRRFSARGRELTVVFDRQTEAPSGAATPGLRAAGVRVRFAASADEAIVALVREARDPSRIRVVSRDREVIGRARQLGATSARVLDFLEELDALGGSEIEPGEPPEKFDP